MKSSTNTIDTSVRLNMDFDNPVCVTPEKHLWETSPEDGVSRLPLERVSPESGHTTSFVRFAPDSFFPAHSHPQGEEIYVLEALRRGRTTSPSMPKNLGQVLGP